MISTPLGQKDCILRESLKIQLTTLRILELKFGLPLKSIIHVHFLSFKLFGQAWML